jgi:hypothetical protein
MLRINDPDVWIIGYGMFWKETRVHPRRKAEINLEYGTNQPGIIWKNQIASRQKYDSNQKYGMNQFGIWNGTNQPGRIIFCGNG